MSALLAALTIWSYIIHGVTFVDSNGDGVSQTAEQTPSTILVYVPAPENWSGRYTFPAGEDGAYRFHVYERVITVTAVAGPCQRAARLTLSEPGEYQFDIELEPACIYLPSVLGGR